MIDHIKYAIQNRKSYDS